MRYNFAITGKIESNNPDLELEHQVRRLLQDHMNEMNMECDFLKLRYHVLISEDIAEV